MTWKEFMDTARTGVGTSFQLTFHWPEYSHVTTPNCKAGWEMQSLCMPKEENHEPGFGENNNLYHKCYPL